MNAVGIDVSKGKSMVVALRPFGEVALAPWEFPHSAIGLEQLMLALIDLGEDTRVIMEATGRYHEPRDIITTIVPQLRYSGKPIQ